MDWYTQSSLSPLSLCTVLCLFHLMIANCPWRQHLKIRISLKSFDYSMRAQKETRRSSSSPKLDTHLLLLLLFCDAFRRTPPLRRPCLPTSYRSSPCVWCRGYFSVHTLFRNVWVTHTKTGRCVYRLSARRTLSRRHSRRLGCSSSRVSICDSIPSQHTHTHTSLPSSFLSFPSAPGGVEARAPSFEWGERGKRRRRWPRHKHVHHPFPPQPPPPRRRHDTHTHKAWIAIIRLSRSLSLSLHMSLSVFPPAQHVLHTSCLDHWPIKNGAFLFSEKRIASCLFFSLSISPNL